MNFRNRDLFLEPGMIWTGFNQANSIQAYAMVQNEAFGGQYDKKQHLMCTIAGRQPKWSSYSI